MDILKRIKSWLKQNNEPPWPIGVDLTKASDGAKFAMTFLSHEEFIAISRYNIFKKCRNGVIKRVKWRYGIPQNIIAELTGLSLQAIKGITPQKKTLGNG